MSIENNLLLTFIAMTILYIFWFLIPGEVYKKTLLFKFAGESFLDFNMAILAWVYIIINIILGLILYNKM